MGTQSTWGQIKNIKLHIVTDIKVEKPNKMGKYSTEPENPTKSCKARGSYLRVHFKNTRETAQAIKKMHIRKANRYLKDVVQRSKSFPSEGSVVVWAAKRRLKPMVALKVDGLSSLLNSCCNFSRMQNPMLMSRGLMWTPW